MDAKIDHVAGSPRQRVISTQPGVSCSWSSLMLIWQNWTPYAAALRHHFEFWLYCDTVGASHIAERARVAVLATVPQEADP